MKAIFKIIFVCMLFFSACSKIDEFGDINQNPVDFIFFLIIISLSSCWIFLEIF